MANVRFPDRLVLPEGAVSNGDAIEYELSGVVVHAGTGPNSGHYYTYAYMQNSKEPIGYSISSAAGDGGNWVLFNDSHVSFADLPRIHDLSSIHARVSVFNACSTTDPLLAGHSIHFTIHQDWT